MFGSATLGRLQFFYRQILEWARPSLARRILVGSGVLTVIALMFQLATSGALISLVGAVIQWTFLGWLCSLGYRYLQSRRHRSVGPNRTATAQRAGAARSPRPTTVTVTESPNSVATRLVNAELETIKRDLARQREETQQAQRAASQQRRRDEERATWAQREKERLETELQSLRREVERQREAALQHEREALAERRLREFEHADRAQHGGVVVGAEQHQPGPNHTLEKRPQEQPVVALSESNDQAKAQSERFEQALPARKAPATRPSLQRILKLSPTEFEVFTGDILRALGYSDVRRVGGAGDMGVDVTATSPDGQRTVVQCKRYAPDRPVGSQPIQNFIGMMNVVHHADAGIFVTTSSFSKQAHELARRYKDRIQLIEGRYLLQLANLVWDEYGNPQAGEGDRSEWRGPDDTNAFEALQALGYSADESRLALDRVEYTASQAVEERVLAALQVLSRS